MSRVAVFCLLSLAIIGCGGNQGKRPTPAVSTWEQGCPTVETEVPAAYCAGVPEGYGLSRNLPAEWGLQAATGVNRMGGPMRSTSLYFGRLLCQDGSTPTILSRWADLLPTPRSTSIRSAHAKPSEDNEDIVDFWKVQCGDTVVRVYSNSYRCGSPCVPAPFRLLPAAAWAAHRKALELQSEGKPEQALPQHEHAVSLFDESVTLQTRLIESYLNNELPEKALVQTDTALQKLPEASQIWLLRVASYLQLERPDEGQRALDDFFLAVHPDDGLIPAAFCYRAKLHAQQGREERAINSAALSCKYGFKECCPPEEASDPEDRSEASTEDSSI